MNAWSIKNVGVFCRPKRESESDHVAHNYIIYGCIYAKRVCWTVNTGIVEMIQSLLVGLWNIFVGTKYIIHF